MSERRSVKRAIDAIERAGGLVTPREIAEEWGVSDQAIADRIQRGTFPEPVKVAGRVRLYLREQVEPFRRDG
jgi:predicted DNA-binding transcriptional regulator AlpA